MSITAFVRFLLLAGGEPTAAREATLTALLLSELRMLDVGCGPGTEALWRLALKGGLFDDFAFLDGWSPCRAK